MKNRWADWSTVIVKDIEADKWRIPRAAILASTVSTVDQSAQNVQAQ